MSEINKKEGDIFANLYPVLEDAEFEKFRRLCRELVFEAKKLNVPPDIVYNGVSWNYLARNGLKLPTEIRLEKGEK